MTASEELPAPLSPPVSTTARLLVASTAVMAQIAAAGAGAIAWPVVAVTAPLTVVVALRRPLRSARARRICGLTGLVILIITGVLVQQHAAQAGVDPAATLRLLTAGLAVLAFVMGAIWGTIREHRLWLVMSAVCLLAAAANGTPGAAALPLLAGWLILIAAAWTLQADAGAAAGTARAVVSVDGTVVPATATYRLRGLAYSLALVSLAGWLVYLVLPGQLGGGGLGTRIANAAGLTPSANGASRSQIGIDTDGSGLLDLSARGPLPDTPLLSVPASSPQLWQATVYSDYTGSTWDAGNLGYPAQLVSGGDVAVPRSADDEPAAGSQRRTDDVRVLTPDVDGDQVSVLWAPGVPLRVHADIAGLFRSNGSVRLSPDGPLDSYRVRSAVPPMSATRLEATGSAIDPGGQAYLQLPAELPPEVGVLTRQVTAGAATTYDKVLAIERYLRTHEKYSLDSPVPAAGQDAVDRFLFHDHVGFCEQFASAETVMLRTLGVPARLVTGVAYGSTEGTRRIITEADAHAWTEVDYAGIGWVPTDPTAGVALAPATPSLPSRIGHDLAVAVRRFPGGLAGLLTALIVLFVGAVLLRVRRRRDGADAIPAGPVLTAFLAFARDRRPVETARDFLDRVGAESDELDRPALVAAVATLEQEVYGAAPPDQPDVDAAISSLSMPPARHRR